MEAQQCAREPTGTNGPTLNNHPTQRVNQNNRQTQPQPLYKPRSTHPHQQQWEHGRTHILWWSQHRGNAQPPFRTWKLSPAAPMVLQPPGCGRVGHRHNTLHREGRTATACRPSRFCGPMPLISRPSSTIGWLNAHDAHHEQERANRRRNRG